MVDNLTPDLDPMASAARLAAVAATGLVGSDAPELEPILERLANVAQTLIRAPLIMVTLLTAEEQWVLAASGSGATRLPGHHLPLAYSLCQHVVRHAATLSIDDTTTHPLVRDDLAVTALGVHAYLGVPLTTNAGQTVGVLCALDFVSREWAADERAALADLAVAAAAHLDHLTVQAELRVVERQLATITSVSAEGVWSWDMVANTAFHSPRFRELLGMTADAGGVDALLAVLHPDDVDTFTAAMQAHLTRHTPFEVQLRLWVGESGYRWFLNRGQAVWSASGTPIFMAGSLIDVSEQVRTAAALRLSEVHLARVVESAMDAVICTTADGEIILFNHAAERIFGVEASLAIRRSLEDFLPGWKLVHSQSSIGSLRPLRALTGRRKDRQTFPAEVTISDSVEPAHATDLATITVIVRDVTERTTLEAELRHAQKMDALGRMAGGIAHDFNNLLTVISGSAEIAAAMLYADQPARDVIPDVEQVVATANRASALTRQLLSFSRKQVLAPQRVCLDVVLHEIEPLLRRLLGAQVKIAVHPMAARAEVIVDPSQLEQILVNLAINARDAMPDGGSLTIRSRLVWHQELEELYADRLAAANALVLLTIEDTGSGMDADTQLQVFEPFFTTKAPGRGTGLGLAIVHGIVEQSGGVIWISSQVGHGTTISIVLPTAPEPVTVNTPAGTPPSTPVVRGHVLLVEDQPDVAALTTRLLSSAGFNVTHCADGEAALRWCRADPDRTRDLHGVVSDVVMPRRDGRSLARELARAFPSLPVLLMSGVDLGSSDDLAPNHAFLKKPFTRASLLQQLAQAISHAGMRTAASA